MHYPKRRENERIIHRSRGTPDFLQAQWANDARVLRKMRFIVPNETGPKNLSVRNENESD
jgi:hypothetical protein